jgi:hypothetical protein
MEVVLHFYLNEEVTPEIFARKVADGLARSGTLREGERVCANLDAYEYVGDVQIDIFGKGQPITVPRIDRIHP